MAKKKRKGFITAFSIILILIFALGGLTYLLPKATVNFEAKNCSFKTLTNYDTLVEVAVENNYIAPQDLEKLKAWKVNPADESWMTK